MMGSVGDFSWPGASGTNWWADPKEELAVVFMAHSPGPIRWHYRQMINALVYQAIKDDALLRVIAHLEQAVQNSAAAVTIRRVDCGTLDATP